MLCAVAAFVVDNVEVAIKGKDYTFLLLRW